MNQFKIYKNISYFIFLYILPQFNFSNISYIPMYYY